MRGSGAYVEVQKKPSSSTWFCACVVDVIGDTVRVGFEDDVWPVGEFPKSSVRRCSPPVEEGWMPVVGEALEVWAPATEAKPGGWTQGRLTNIKSKDFFFVALEGLKRSSQDIISERAGIRPVSMEPTLAESALKQRLVPVDPVLQGWLRPRDLLGFLDDVLVKAKLLMVGCTGGDGDGDDEDGGDGGDEDEEVPAQVTLLGDECAVGLGEKLLVEVHFKHQKAMQRFNTHREKLMLQLTRLQKQQTAVHCDTFMVDSSFIPRVIGKKGANIKRLRKDHNVDIMVGEPELLDGAWLSPITVSGEQLEDVREAREAVEFVKVEIPVEQEQVGWIVGRGYNNLMDIARETELEYAWFNDESSAIELCGRRAQVENAELMIGVHQNYLGVHQGLNSEWDSIQKRFEELDGHKSEGKAGGRRGRGSSKRGKGPWHGAVGTPWADITWTPDPWESSTEPWDPSWGWGSETWDDGWGLWGEEPPQQTPAGGGRKGGDK